MTSRVRQSKGKYNRSLKEENSYNPRQCWKALKSLFPHKSTLQIHSKVFEIAGKMEYNKEKITNGFCVASTICAEKLCNHLPSSLTWQNDGDTEQQRLAVHVSLHDIHDA